MTAIRQQVKVFIDQNLSPQARARQLAVKAKEGLAELQNSGRASRTYHKFVDGRANAPEESVKPGGVILYEFAYVGEAVVFALGFLRRRAPIRSGRFRDAFIVAVDGRPIRWSEFNPRAVPADAEVMIYNPLPFARKVDVQIANGRAVRFSAPPNLFEDAGRAVRQQFGGAVKARRLYSITFPGQYVLKRGDKRGSRVQSPALVLSAI